MGSRGHRRCPGGKGSLSVRKLALAVLCSLAGFFTFASAPAWAVREYSHAGTFGSAGSGNGQFNEPTGVAVNGSNEPLIQPEGGDVYVIDTGNSRVERFSAAGSYLGQFNGAGSFEVEGKVQAGPATPAKSFAFSSVNDAQGIAVDSSTSALDPSAGAVYVMDFGNKVVDKFSALGKYEESQLTGTCPKPGTCTAGEVIPFPELQGVAVDPAGNVWVYTTGANNVDEFSDTGAFVRSYSTGVSTSPAFAVDASDNFYAAFGNGVVGKFEGGKEVAEFAPSGANSVAANSVSAEVLADEGSFIELYGPITERRQKPIQTLGPLASSFGVAVDSGNEAAPAYASQRQANDVEVFNSLLFPTIALEEASGVLETGVTLNGTLSLEGVALNECKFEYGIAQASEHSVPCKQTPAEINALSKGGTVPVHVSVELASLQVRTSYVFRLSAANASGTRSSQVDTFYTAARPAIENESNSGVGSTEATVAAQINPSGEVTHYRVEYGTSNVEESTTPELSVGAARGPQNVVVTLNNMQAGASYHARFVASNPLGATVGKELAFTTNKAQAVSSSGGSTCPNRTFSGFSASLPDCRAFELVSDDIDETYVPEYSELGPEEGGGTGEFIGSFSYLYAVNRASANGEAMIYVGGESNSGVGGNGTTGNGAGNQYVSMHGANGWKASDISVPINAKYGAFFEAFSEDLSVQLLDGNAPASEPLEAEPKLLPECVERAANGIYSRDASGLHALVPMNHGSGTCEGKPAVISADDSHLLFEAAAPYTEEAKQTPESGKNLYDSVKNVLHQVNVLPDGEVEQNPYASFGSIEYENGSRGGDMIGAVSSDGSRIFWTQAEGEGSKDLPKALYVRENDVQPQSPVAGGRCTVPTDACTVQLDASQGGPGASGGGYFWAAADDSNRVFFTDCSKLTSDSTAHAEAGCVHKSGSESLPSFTGNDLYEYDFEKPVGERLTDLTVDHNPDPLGADVQGVIGTSEDGSYVYLVAHGVLAGSNAEGKSPVAGQPNLYMLHGGSTSFIVTLASSDYAIIQGGGGSLEVGDWQPTPGARTAQVSPSGDAVAFLSRLELTGYDNYGAVGFRQENGKFILSEPTSFEHIPELFVYQTSTGRIVCASCSPTGAAPSPLGLPRARLPGTTVATSQGPAFVSRWLVDREGTQTYFMTDQPLVANDSNGLQDVYEWQSEGSGGCRLASGCVSLISTAETASNAYLFDTAMNGRDVFFSSRSQLTKGGGGERLKLYDARIDGGSSEPSLSCTGTGCQGIPPAPPIFATPSSVTFNGVGNFEPSPSAVVKQKAKAKACKRGFHRRRNQCVRSKRKRGSGSDKGSARKSSKGRGR